MKPPDGIVTIFESKDGVTIQCVQREIVLCKNCAYRERFNGWKDYICALSSADPYEAPVVEDDDFCSSGRRREKGEG